MCFVVLRIRDKINTFLVTKKQWKAQENTNKAQPDIINFKTVVAKNQKTVIIPIRWIIKGMPKDLF